MDIHDHSDHEIRIITNEKMLASKAFLFIYTDDNGNTGTIFHDLNLNDLESTGFRKKVLDYCEEYMVDLNEVEWGPLDDDDD